ncbi:unnamed protein product, partial [Ectocarpus sp. 12 AP-2014]
GASSSAHRAHGRGAPGRGGGKSARAGSARGSSASVSSAAAAAGKAPHVGGAGAGAVAKEIPPPAAPSSPADMMDVSESPLNPVFGSSSSPGFVFQAGQPRASPSQQQQQQPPPPSPPPSPPPAYTAMPVPPKAAAPAPAPAPAPASDPGIPPRAFVFGSSAPAPAAPPAGWVKVIPSPSTGLKPIPSPSAGRFFSVGSSVTPPSRSTAMPQARPAAPPQSRPPAFTFGGKPDGVPATGRQLTPAGSSLAGGGVTFSTGTVSNAGPGRRGQRGRPTSASSLATPSRSSNTQPPPPGERDWHGSGGGGFGAVEQEGLKGVGAQHTFTGETDQRPAATPLKSPLATATSFFASMLSPRRKAAAAAAAAVTAAAAAAAHDDDADAAFPDQTATTSAAPAGAASAPSGAAAGAPQQENSADQEVAPAYQPLREDVVPPPLWTAPGGGDRG